MRGSAGGIDATQIGACPTAGAPVWPGREPEASSQSTQRMTFFVTEDAEWPEAHMASGGRVQTRPK